MIKIHINNKRHQQKGGNFIALACSYKSEVIAAIKGENINAKSIMKAPSIEKAEHIDFIITGNDEKEAADAISTYFEERMLEKNEEN